MKQKDVETIKKMADVVLHENPFPVNSIGWKIADAMIRLNGFYTYINSDNQKVFFSHKS